MGLLFEALVDTIQTEIPVNRNFNRDQSVQRQKNSVDDPNHKGGKYSNASPTNDPFTFKKWTMVPEKNQEKIDPYWAFAKALIEDGMTDNPFFPKIYEIKTYTDPQGLKHKKAEMEKLIPFSKIPEEAKELMVRLFGEKIIYRKQIKRDYVEKMVKSNDSDGVENEQLKEAIHFMNKVWRSHASAALDLHPGNYMFRRTSVGLQLVFTDPFAVFLA